MIDPSLRRRVYAAIDEWQHNAAVSPCLGMAPSARCDAKPAKNHSIQNRAVIELLQRDNHVYRIAEAGGVAREFGFMRVGRNKASVFTGYCNAHDALVFRDIDFRDASEFRPEDRRQQALFALRALARECWAKTNSIALHTHLAQLVARKDIDGVATALNIPASDASSFLENFDDRLAPFLLGTNLGLAELGHRFESLRVQIATEAWHHSVFRSWVIPCSPSLAVSAVISPGVDFHGNVIADLGSRKPVAHVALTVVPRPSNTVVLLQYHRRSRGAIDTLARQLDAMADAERAVSLSQFIVVNCENALYSPALVNQLSGDEKVTISELYGATLLLGCPDYRTLPRFSLFRCVHVDLVVSLE